MIFDLMRRIMSLFAALLSLLNFNSQKTNVELYHNPSSRYIWEYEMDKSGILSYSDSHYTPDSGSVLSGKGGGTKYYTFKAIGTGTVNITFRYYRYEKTEKIVASQYVYTYIVDKDGVITLKNLQ